MEEMTVQILLNKTLQSKLNVVVSDLPFKENASRQRMWHNYSYTSQHYNITGL